MLLKMLILATWALMMNHSAFADPALLKKLEYSAQYSANPDLSAASQLSSAEKAAFAKYIYDTSVVNLKRGEFLGPPIIWLVNQDRDQGADLLRIMVGETRYSYKDALRILQKLPQNVRTEVLRKEAEVAFHEERPELVKLLIEAGYHFDFRSMLLSGAQECDAELLYKVRLFTDLDPNKIVDSQSGSSIVEIAKKGEKVRLASIDNESPYRPNQCRTSYGILAEGSSSLSSGNFLSQHSELKIIDPKDWANAQNLAKPQKQLPPVEPEGIGN